MGELIVKFDEWERVLRDTVPAKLQADYREAIAKFLYWLRAQGKTASVAAFKEHLAWKQSYLPPERYEIRRQALRWYYHHGRKLPAETAAVAHGASGAPGVPPAHVVPGVSARPVPDDTASSA